MTDHVGAEVVQDAQRLVSVFGHWPDFHDSEILAMRLDRHRRSGRPSLEIDVHVCSHGSAVDERGFYEQSNHTLASLRFDRIGEL